MSASIRRAWRAARATSRALAPAAAALLAAASLAPRPALAHAILVDSTPAAGSTVAAGAVPLELRFNSRIDAARSRLTLIGPAHSESRLPLTAGGSPDTLQTTATLAPGRYVVRWQVLAIDGHITRGDVPLTAAGR